MTRARLLRSNLFYSYELFLIKNSLNDHATPKSNDIMASYNPSEDVSRGKYSTTKERRKIILNVRTLQNYYSLRYILVN